jgi:hypothetical protein
MSVQHDDPDNICHQWLKLFVNIIYSTVLYTHNNKIMHVDCHKYYEYEKCLATFMSCLWKFMVQYKNQNNDISYMETDIDVWGF